jgi:hypothetical protein
MQTVGRLKMQDFVLKGKQYLSIATSFELRAVRGRAREKAEGNTFLESNFYFLKSPRTRLVAQGPKKLVARNSQLAAFFDFPTSALTFAAGEENALLYYSF